MAQEPSTWVENCLDRLRNGDAQARDDLLRHSSARLTELVRAMLKSFRRLRRWEETDDVLQGALLRLHRALQTVAPASARDYYRLATTQIKRELIDLARHYFGPAGLGRKHESAVPADRAGGDAAPDEPHDTTLEPGRLAVWTEFHHQVQDLPDEERDVFDLVWYQGLKLTEAAALLDVSARTVTRRWHAACLKLPALQEISRGA